MAPLNTIGAQTATPFVEFLNLLKVFRFETGGLGNVNRGFKMTQTSKFIVPALVALSMFAFAPAHADGPDKNGGGDTDKNGSGDTDKNGGGDTDKNGGGGNTGGGSKNGGGGGGNGSSYEGGYGVITCVVNGRVFKVRNIKDCTAKPRYRHYEVRKTSHKRRGVVSGELNYGDCGCATGGGYVYAPQPVIRYYKPASRAAIMQAQKREAAYAYSYEGEYVVKRKKHRRVRAQMPIYMPSYDQGYVIHYGPTISKDGGY